MPPCPTHAPKLSRRLVLPLLGFSAGFFCIRRAGASPGALGIDLEGRPVASLEDRGARSIAAFFIATDCPISNRYLPEISGLATEFTPLGVRFWLVYPNPADDLVTVRAHQSSYPATAAVHTLVAPDPLFIRRAGVHVTPEAALFRPGSAGLEPAVWHGPIDDRYLTIAQHRAVATRRYAAEAMQAALTGKQPASANQHAVGCAIIPRS